MRVTSRATKRRYRQGGFTLIELLVVLVILGILSAVVVFAVRGAGDKGQEEAIDTDARIVRTAQEAFCARYGRYANNMQELADGPPEIPGAKGFLSEPSTNNRIIPKQGGGSCGAYELGEPDPRCQPAAWCDAALPENRNFHNSDGVGPSAIAQLPNGKVLVAGIARGGMDLQLVLGTPSRMGVEMHLYDPREGPLGSWSDASPARARGHSFAQVQDMVVLGGEGCSPRCGMVLAYVFSVEDPPGVHLGLWSLYNPAGPDDDDDPNTEGAWTPIAEGAVQRANDFLHAMVQLRGSGCTPHCGKVLIVGGVQPTAELYDPAENRFEPLGIYGDPTKRYIDVSAVPLPDGRVFIHQIRLCDRQDPVDTADCGEDVAGRFGRRSVVFLFNPAGGTGNWFDNVPAPGTSVTRCTDLGGCWEEGLPSHNYKWQDVARTLPDGRVLLLHRHLDIYTPGPPGDDGTWRAGADCADPATAHRCVILGVLEDGSGRVLGQRVVAGSAITPGTAFFIDPGSEIRYSDAPGFTYPDGGFPVPGVWLSGNCANCGKLFTTDAWGTNNRDSRSGSGFAQPGRFAQLFTPE